MKITNQTPEFPDIFIYINTIIGSISLICLIFAFFTFLKVRKIQQYLLTLFSRLFISSLFTTVTYMFPSVLFDKDGKGCKLTGFGMIWFEHSLYLNLLIITISSFYNSKRIDTQNYNLSKTINISFIFLSFIFPLIIAIVFYQYDLLGESYYTCWIKPQDAGMVLNWIFYVYYWLLLLTNIILIILVFKNLNIYQSQLNREKKLLHKSITNLLSYPLIQFITNLPITVAKLVNYSNNEDLNLKLKEISLLFLLIQGTLFVVAYCYNYKIIEELCKKKKKDHNDLESVFPFEQIESVMVDNKSVDTEITEF
jgi:hypothetical protein